MDALKDENIVKLAAGTDFSLALTHDRYRLYSFGLADKGQLGIGRVTDKWIATPRLVKFDKHLTIAEIDAGDQHGLAISDDNELYTWGFNEVGATGHPSEAAIDIYRPKLVNLMDYMGADVHAHGISGGGQHTLIRVKRYAGRDKVGDLSDVP